MDGEGGRRERGGGREKRRRNRMEYRIENVKVHHAKDKSHFPTLSSVMCVCVYVHE